MDKTDVMKAIEDLLDQSVIPMKNYTVRLCKENGECWLDICGKNLTSIPEMYLFSEIFNSYTQDWYVHIDKQHIHLIIK